MSGRTEFGSLGSTFDGRTTTRFASTQSTVPSRLATTVTPESRATMCSMPVPINGVVVLEEWNQRRGHRDQLVRRHFHQRHVFRLAHDHVRALAARHVIGNELAGLLLAVRVGDDLALLLERREELHLFADPAALDGA